MLWFPNGNALVPQHGNALVPQRETLWFPNGNALVSQREYSDFPTGISNQA